MGTLQGTDYTNWAGYAELACFAEVTFILVLHDISQPGTVMFRLEVLRMSSVLPLPLVEVWITGPCLASLFT